MSTPARFSPETTGLVTRVRRNSVADLLRRTAARHPEKLGVVDGPRRMTFAEFDQAVDRCAAALAERDLVKGDRLAILSHNCWQFAMLLFATARIGVVLVPLNFMLGAGEIAYILGHCGARGMIVEDALIATAEQAATEAGMQSVVWGAITLTGTAPAGGWEDVDAWAEPSDRVPPEVDVADDDLIRLMYTSGTEGRPKGVMLSSRSLIAQYSSLVVDGGMQATDVEVHALPFYHCGQLDCFFSVDMFLGATSIILPRPDPAVLLATIERERVTKLFCPPTVWISLLRHPDFESADLSSLRKGYYGASPMPVEVLRELQDRLPHVRLWNLYGQSEMSPTATILGPDDQLSHAGSAGRAVLNVETRVVDEDGIEVAPGEVGEVVHRSPQATLGYYNDEERTADAFRDQWFHSGDLGIMTEDGYLTIVDRKKDMIKTGGENVASREVEEAIYLLDGISEVAVFGVPHRHWIEAVTAVVVPRPGAVLTEDAVHEHVQQHLAPYKRPKYVVVADELPKNSTGKILKRDLRAKYARLADERVGTGSP
jgi:fatty-acyl-CoA synthase